MLALDPDNFDAMLFQGRLDLARGEPAKAVTDMERMTRVYADQAVAHYQLGNAYFAANDPIKAVGSLNRALELAVGRDTIIVSAGSMFVTAEVKTAWQKLNNRS